MQARRGLVGWVSISLLPLAITGCRLDPPSADDFLPTEVTSGGVGPSPMTSSTTGGLDSGTTTGAQDSGDGEGTSSGDGTASGDGSSSSDGGPDPACGNGIVDPELDEDCDDGEETATCDADCTFVDCGDGWANAAAGELCDDGGESATCDVDCTPAVCGDGTFNATANEECDEAGRTAACDDDCTLVDCGDGNVNMAAGEVCDDMGESMACNSDCSTSGCGDGITNTTAGEQCDDVGDSLGCDADCTLVECGDLTINTVAGEECDDTDLAGATCTGEGFDGGTLSCSATCQLDTTACFECGDGVLNGAEQCDGGDLGGATCASQGFDGGSLGCDATCGFDSSGCYECGDGVINGAEQCDGPSLGGASCVSRGFDGGSLSCAPNCTYDTSACYECGDGAIDPGEQCDGATLGGATCASEGFDSGSLSCTPSCTYDTSACLSCDIVGICPVMWLRADVGVITNASGVTVWEDQSGLGNDVTQGTAANEPALLSPAVNGLPAVDFLGDDWLMFGSALSLDDLTIFVVARNNNPAETIGMIFGPWADNNQIRFQNSTQILSVGSGNGLPSITSTIGDNRVYHSLTIRYDGATWEVRRDGVVASSNPVAVAGPLTLGRLGSWFSGQHGLIGEIAEIMVYDTALSGSQRATVEDYLRTRYALP